MRFGIGLTAAGVATLLGVVAGPVGARLLVSRVAFVPDTGSWTARTPGALSPEPWRSVERAAQAERDPAAFPPDTLAIWMAALDGDGRPLDGRSRYVLRLSAAPAPDGAGFWSLFVLDGRGEVFAGGARPSLTSRTRELRRDPDGATTVSVGAAPPDDPAENWLPAPAGAFRLVFRTFLLPPPEAPRPPTIRRRETAA